MSNGVRVARQLSRKRRIWTVVITVLFTVLASALALNFATPEKRLELAPRHLYPISDPQLRRDMGLLLGPAILPGNRITDLENGDEIFPAMLDAIHSAQKTITFNLYLLVRRHRQEIQRCVERAGKGRRRGERDD